MSETIYYNLSFAREAGASCFLARRPFTSLGNGDDGGAGIFLAWRVAALSLVAAFSLEMNASTSTRRLVPGDSETAQRLF
jgi:hypothetical protein